MPQTTQKLILKLLDHPKYTLSFLAAVTIILGSYLPGLKMDFTMIFLEKNLLQMKILKK